MLVDLISLKEEVASELGISYEEVDTIITDFYKNFVVDKIKAYQENDSTKPFKLLVPELFSFLSKKNKKSKDNEKLCSS